jgi:hypothetical protein
MPSTAVFDGPEVVDFLGCFSVFADFDFVDDEVDVDDARKIGLLLRLPVIGFILRVSSTSTFSSTF